MRILYVENHARFARLVTNRFLADHSVTVVPSIMEARRVLSSSQFDFLPVDYDLDDGKGTELIRGLPSNGYRIPILAVSSHFAGNEALISAGAHGACSKANFAHIAAIHAVCENWNSHQ